MEYLKLHLSTKSYMLVFRDVIQPDESLFVFHDCTLVLLEMYNWHIYIRHNHDGVVMG